MFFKSRTQKQVSQAKVAFIKGSPTNDLLSDALDFAIQYATRGKTIAIYSYEHLTTKQRILAKELIAINPNNKNTDVICNVQSQKFRDILNPTTKLSRQIAQKVDTLILSHPTEIKSIIHNIKVKEVAQNMNTNLLIIFHED